MYWELNSSRVRHDCEKVQNPEEKKVVKSNVGLVRLVVLAVSVAVVDVQSQQFPRSAALLCSQLHHSSTPTTCDACLVSTDSSGVLPGYCHADAEPRNSVSM